MIALAKLHASAGGLCRYCGCETHVPGATSRLVLAKRYGIEIGPRGWRIRLRNREATREHVVRVADGGGNALTNLMLACKWCNTTRGDASPEQHIANIARAIAEALHPNHGQRSDLGTTALRRARKAIGLSTFSVEAAHVG